MRVLVVEDEKRLAAGLRNGLEAEGFAVDVALDGTDGLWMAREHPYDAIVLDIMLPGVNGYKICGILRNEGVWTPILMLTAKDGEWDEVEALDTGADDYLTKPFSYPVLVARLRALLRRGAAERPPVLEAGDLRLDPATKQAWRGDLEVELTARELALLEFLLRRRGEVVSKREILDHVWDYDFEGDPNIVEVYVRHLRNKLDRPFGREAIETFRGLGIGSPLMVADSRRSLARRLASRAGTVRVRTTVAAVVVVGVALLAGSLALVAILGNTLTREVLNATRLRAGEVAAVLESGIQPSTIALLEEDDTLVQVLDEEGAVVASSPTIEGERPLARLRPGESAEIGVAGDDDDFLAVAASADTPQGRYIVVVARGLEVVTDSTRTVSGVLVIGLPVLLLVIAVTTWRVVGRALAPVDAIRSEVEVISAVELHRRVPELPSDDEIARLASTMNRMLDRLEQAQARQRRFISDASHELRSPVASIRQHAEVALAHPERTTAAELAETVLSEDLRVQRLVEGLLVLARADEHTLQLRRRPLDLDDLVFDEARRLRDTTGLDVRTVEVSAGRVRGDAAGLARVVRNLGDNAARHAHSRVSFCVAERNGTVVLSVDDDGPGIAEANRERVFERFVRLDDARTRDHGGSGLGLAIVAELIGAHGGSVTVSDSPLGGARVEVILPCG